MTSEELKATVREEHPSALLDDFFFCVANIETCRESYDIVRDELLRRLCIYEEASSLAVKWRL